MVLAAFRERVNPVSTMANPTCMNITRNPHRSTQARLSDCSSCTGMVYLERLVVCGAGGGDWRALSQTSATSPRRIAGTMARSTSRREMREPPRRRRLAVSGSRGGTADGFLRSASICLALP